MQMAQLHFSPCLSFFERALFYFLGRPVSHLVRLDAPRPQTIIATFLLACPGKARRAARNLARSYRALIV
jgi:hypothetical protein